MRRTPLVIAALVAGTLTATLLVLGARRRSEPTPPQRDQAVASLDRAIAYLAKSQYPFGAFPTYQCQNTRMERCDLHPILFNTASILLALGRIDDPRVAEMQKRAARLFVEQQNEQGLWDFYVWKSRSPEYVQSLPEYTSPLYLPDLDDTACISRFLEQVHVAFRDNRGAIRANKEHGRFLTFFERNGYDTPPPPHSGNVDPVVNANALMYLRDEDPAVCSFILDAAKNASPSLYYQDRTIYYALIARAHGQGVACLAGAREPIVSYLLAERRADGSFGTALQTAAALSALFEFGYREPAVVEPAIRALLAQQGPDGSWPTALYFAGPIMGFGSEPTSTAFAAEALFAYSRSP